MALRKFSSQEIRISHSEAINILRFFWPDIGIQANQVTDSDRAFAQALLVEAIDKSYDMGYVESIFKAFFMKIPASFGAIRTMVLKFAHSALKNWFKHATQKDLLDPKVYENVRLALARNFRSVWKIREQTGELTY